MPIASTIPSRKHLSSLRPQFLFRVAGCWLIKNSRKNKLDVAQRRIFNCNGRVAIAGEIMGRSWDAIYEPAGESRLEAARTPSVGSNTQ